MQHSHLTFGGSDLDGIAGVDANAGTYIFLFRNTGTYIFQAHTQISYKPCTYVFRKRWYAVLHGH